MRILGYSMMVAVMLVPNLTIIILTPPLALAACVCLPFSRPEDDASDEAGTASPEFAAAGRRG